MEAEDSEPKHSPQPVAVPVDPARDLKFNKALAFLRTLVDFAEVEQLHPARDNAV